MGPSSRSGDDWSETSFSEPRRGGPRSGEDARGSRAVSTRPADEDWGTPSYSRRDDDATRIRPTDPARNGRPTDPARNGRPTDPARNGRPADPARNGRPAGGARREPQRPARVEHRQGDPRRDSDTRTAVQPAVDDGWSRSGPTSTRDQRATRAADRRAEQERQRTQASVDRLSRQAQPAVARPYERGLQWWSALGVLIGITALGAVIDSVGDISSQDGFNYGIVVASLAAIVLVKRSQMFPIVVAPPIVYALAAMVQLYLKSSVTSQKHGLINTILDAVQNYLVYGFPALASATAGVLIIAGVRLIARR